VAEQHSEDSLGIFRDTEQRECVSKSINIYFNELACGSCSLDLKGPTKVHILKAWSPGWGYWKVVESLGGRA
jgi:hypothetical protein